MTKTIHGTVRGKPGVADGEEVGVAIRTISEPTVHRSGEGFSRTHGALADDTEWDAIMDETYRAWKQERRPQIPSLTER